MEILPKFSKFTLGCMTTSVIKMRRDFSKQIDIDKDIWENRNFVESLWPDYS